MRFVDSLRSLDWIIVTTTILLIAIGLAMLFSASYDDAIFSFRFIRQSAAALFGLTLSFFIAYMSYFFWQRYALILYGLGLLSLIYVSLAARVIRGTASRLEFFGIQIQPSEFMKIALVIVLAYIFSRLSSRGFKTLFLSLLITAVPVALVLLEPDAGMAALLLALWLISVVFIGFSWKKLSLIFIIGVIGAFVSWHSLLADYQKTRLQTFVDPSHDPLGSGYNITQSIVALGSGQLFGRGLGHGPQSQLNFLPEQHTDFIFASIGEELGFLGVLVVIILYCILLWRVLTVAKATEDRFGRLLAIGTFSVLLVSFIVSAGMNIGLLPVTGIPLPLISYGGSSLASTLILLGLVQSVIIHNEWSRPAPHEISHFT